MTTQHAENPPTKDQSSPPRRWDLLAITVVVPVVFALRVALATQAPVNTGDIVRNLAYGAGFWMEGPGFAGHSLDEWSGLEWIAWSENPYNYPPAAFLFFALISLIHSSVFVGKLALTAVEAVNAWLIYRLTKDKWCGLIYWCAPVSLWWASGEGQFEGLQSMFALLAILAVRRNIAAGCGLLALAIQTKLTAVVLLPFFVMAVTSVDKDKRYREAGMAFGGFATGCLLTALALVFYPAVAQVAGFSAPMRLNPFHWNFMNIYLTGTYLPAKLWQQFSSWMILSLVILAAFRSRAFAACLPALLFLLLMKSWSHVQFWYWLALAPMLVLIPNVCLRRVLFVLWALCEFNASVQWFTTQPLLPFRQDYYDFSIFEPIKDFLIPALRQTFPAS